MSNNPTAKVIAYSISPDGIPLLSVQIKCHRFLLPEINTHRALSRNYRSSRAVPVAKLIQEVRDNPAEPIAWMKNKPGMQASEPMSPEEERLARELWRTGARHAADTAQDLLSVGLHKQWANRPLEPYLFVHGILTATDWANFYALRRHPDAQPEFKALADAIYEAHQEATPRLLRPGEWHLPYVSEEDWDVFGAVNARFGYSTEDLERVMIKVSTARCARVSVRNFEDKPSSLTEDLALYEKLVGAAPIHASPAEHQATPDISNGLTEKGWLNNDLDKPEYGEDWQQLRQHGNLTGWRQFRKMLLNECIRDAWGAQS